MELTVDQVTDLAQAVESRITWLHQAKSYPLKDAAVRLADDELVRQKALLSLLRSHEQNRVKG
jgi:hypothetical protein